MNVARYGLFYNWYSKLNIEIEKCSRSRGCSSSSAYSVQLSSVLFRWWIRGWVGHFVPCFFFLPIFVYLIWHGSNNRKASVNCAIFAAQKEAQSRRMNRIWRGTKRPLWLTLGQIEKGRRWLAHLNFIATRSLDEHLTAGMQPPIINIHSHFP